MALPENGNNQSVDKPADGKLQKLQIVVKSNISPLSLEDVKELGLTIDPKVPTFTSAERVGADGKPEHVYLLSTRGGSVFLLEKDDPMVQELKMAAAAAAIDAFEATSPLEIAGSVKKSIEGYGYKFTGGPLEALDLAIEAMGKLRQLQENQLKVINLNAAQAAARQLTSDIGEPLHKFMVLPPHRKLAAMLFSETMMVVAAQDLLSPDTVEVAKDMQKIGKHLSERRAELMNMWVEHVAQAGSTLVTKTGETAATLIATIITKGGDSAGALMKVLVDGALGKGSFDEGTVRKILQNAGEGGQRLLDLIESSGLTINKFFRNLFSSKSESGDQSQYPEEMSGDYFTTSEATSGFGVNKLHPTQPKTPSGAHYVRGGIPNEPSDRRS